MSKNLCQLALLLCGQILYAQTITNPLLAVRQSINGQKVSLVKDYAAFLGLPNTTADSVNIEKNAAYIATLMQACGIDTRLLRLPNRKANPLVYGSILTPGATTTIGLYAHYDGQPVNASRWTPPLQPYRPTLLSNRHDRGGQEIPFETLTNPDDQWRLYARSSADDKAGVFAILQAYRLLKNLGIQLRVNVKFMFEGEEEKGSVNLGAYFQQFKRELQADTWVILDGPRHLSGEKQLVLGVRGDANVELKLYGPKRPLHSGNYGNWAPNPAMRLSQLLATMTDKSGKVVIKDFYKGVRPLSVADNAALNRLPSVERDLQHDLGIAVPDGNGRSYYELMTLPTLNVNSIAAGAVDGGAANVISTEATAVLDLRLVPGTTVEGQIQKVINHIKAQGYYVLGDREPTAEERLKHNKLIRVRRTGGGYEAQRSSLSDTYVQRVYANLKKTAPGLLVIPSVGGSLPLYLFEKLLGSKPVTVCITNFDSNQHGEDENLQLKYLWEAIESAAAVLLLE